MELLATVHWVATKETNAAINVEQAISLIHSWSERKRNLLAPQHIRKAWQRLSNQNWLTPASTK